MKKLFRKLLLLTFLILELIPNGHAENLPIYFSNNEAKSTDEVSKSYYYVLTVTIIIARRRDCDGFGICRFSVSLNEEYPRLNQAIGNITKDPLVKGNLLIEINKMKGITQEAYNKYFSNGTFIMEDDYQIPADISNKLELGSTQTLIAGKYKVIESNGNVIVSIPLK